eukprot:12531650-Prorocentrum_lima.AAC.1
MSVEEQQAKDGERKRRRGVLDGELKKRDQFHQALIEQRVDTAQQQLALAKEAVNKERDRADRLQVRLFDFSP